MRKFFMASAIAIIAAAINVTVAFAASFTEQELSYMSATRLIELFKRGEVTPTQVLEAQIARVEKYNGQIKADTRDLLDNPLTWNGKVNAITAERFAAARSEARAAEERYKNGTNRPLEGITVGVKCDLRVPGWRNDNATIVMKDVPPATENDTVVQRLIDAGAIPVFQTTAPELFISSMTWSNLYGVTRNPWNEKYGAGGSSGGSGAALAAGFCTIATGSDMGGSIRIPSAMNGVYGFKPPFSRIPCDDEMPYVVYGPMTRTFDDLVLMQNIISGPSPEVFTSLPKVEMPAKYDSLKGAKIAVMYLDKYNEAGIDDDVRTSMGGVVSALRSLGAQVDIVESSWRVNDENLKVYINGLIGGSMALTLDSMRDMDQEQFTPYLRDIFKVADNTGNAGKAAATMLAAELNNDVQQRVFTKGYTALIMPTMMTPHVLADVDSSDDTRVVLNGRKVPSSIMNCATMYWNVLYTYPVVDVPVAVSSRNVPMGVQVVGNTYDDIAAFRVASALSKTLKQNFSEGRFPDFRMEK